MKQITDKAFDPLCSKFWSEEGWVKTLNNEPKDLSKLSGQWKTKLENDGYEVYLNSLGGRPTESFDPKNYLGKLGLDETLTAGRTNIEQLLAARAITEDTEFERLKSIPEKWKPLVRKVQYFASHIPPKLINFFDKAVAQVLMKIAERPVISKKAFFRSYGLLKEIDKGTKSDQTKEQRYANILQSQLPQYTWDYTVHDGFQDPSGRPVDAFGTLHVARMVGFTEEQARRIAAECFNVDRNRTHYRDPYAPDFWRRTTARVLSKKGDLHWHFNRRRYGKADSRISAARIHMVRALRLAHKGYYEAAERELGIGLHSIQDMFAHGQINPLIHVLLGDIPDEPKFNAIGLYETMVATEGYLRLFTDNLHMKLPAIESEWKIKSVREDHLVGGNASYRAKKKVRIFMETIPLELQEFLRKNQIKIFVGDTGINMADLGYGMVENKEGDLVMSGVSRRKLKHFDNDDPQSEEVSTVNKFQNLDGSYNHITRTIFISERVTKKDSQLEQVLQHELRHVVDACLQDNPALHIKWNSFIQQQFQEARRMGDVGFDEVNPHELFARGL